MRAAATCFALQSVTVSRGGRPVLQIPTLCLAAGVTTAVVGPSGAGKSTLLRVLAGLEPPDAGKVVAEGPEGQALSPGEIVMVFQRPALLRATVAENTALGLRLRGDRGARAQVLPWLKRLGLAEKANQGASTLSGGEYQRVALARALVLAPAALLLDEPTANLDPANVALIERLVQQTQAESGMTVIWVTHNPLQARRVAAAVVLLAEGQVIAHAETEQFFGESADPRVRAFLDGRTIW